MGEGRAGNRSHERSQDCNKVAVGDTTQASTSTGEDRAWSSRGALRAPTRSGDVANGFDVQSGSATALLVRSDNKTLYTVDLDTGAASGATALPSGLGDVTGFTLT